MPIAKSRPLSSDVRRRIKTFHRSGGGTASWQEIADSIGRITGAAIRNYVENGSNVQNPEMAARIVRVLEHYENERDGVAQSPQHTQNELPTSQILTSDISLEQLLRLISAKGFNVSVTMAGVEF